MQNAGENLRTDTKSFDQAFEIIRWACVFLFLGRAWQHLFWDPPYRTLIWDESLLKSFIENWTSFTWQQWVTDPRIDGITNQMVGLIGLFYLLCAACAARVKSGRTFEKATLLLGAVSLGFLSFLYGKSRFYQIAQFLEYALQVGTPIFLVWMTRAKETSSSVQAHGFQNLIKTAVILTFACHGLYAIGYYPIPGHYLDMTMNILGVHEATATRFLFGAAIMDFAVCFGLLFRTTTPFAFLYAAFWGTTTAFARLVSNVSWGTFGADLHQWAAETALRLPHGLVPLAALLLFFHADIKLKSLLKKTSFRLASQSDIPTKK